MEFPPGTLLEPTFLADLMRLATTVFAGVALLAAGLIVTCVGGECGRLWRLTHQNSHRAVTRAHVHAPAGR